LTLHYSTQVNNTPIIVVLSYITLAFSLLLFLPFSTFIYIQRITITPIQIQPA